MYREELATPTCTMARLVQLDLKLGATLLDPDRSIAYESNLRTSKSSRPAV